VSRLRVIQWTTGKVGKLALRGILDDPRLELVGVYAYSDDKAGVDAGKLCGRPDCGVKAARDVAALVALKADTVLYTPFMADLDHVVSLLEGGADVISTNLFLNYGGVQGHVKEQLEAACKHGNSSLYISGVSPGWINSMIVAMTAVCRDVQCVSILEAADCSVYESKETWLAMGMSMPKATPEVIQTARNWLLSFYDAVQRMAVALDITLDDTEFFIEYATASKQIDLGWFCMEQGTNAAVRAGWKGKVKGNTVVQFTLLWYLTRHLNEGWEFPDNQYTLSIKGEPEIAATIRFIPPKHWGNHEWDTMTALPAVSAAFNVAAARPGVLNLKDAGLVTAPMGVWLGKSG
jgi:hypothetical protein